MAAYAQLIEADWLDQAREVDARYHLAKMIGQVMTEDGWTLVRDEHDQWRSSLLPAPEVAPVTEDALTIVYQIDARLREKGILKAMH